MAAPSLLARSRVLLRKTSASLKPSKNFTGVDPPPVLRPSSRTRSSTILRLPMISESLLSMLPLHSAVASCRLKSVLSAESQSWGLIPQGNSMPL
ncbi:hypothetical protein LUZ60_004473 [Juncus effusus]|nr:hypothetical protein LUZ60_004473 [Juncus effusus]